MKLSRLGFAAAFAGAAFGATAQEVVLTSKSTGFTLVGPLLEFDGERYMIQSTIGRLSVLAEDVECVGSGCPTVAGGAGSLARDFGVMGSNTIGADLMPSLIEAYSFALGAEAEMEIGAGAERSVFRLRGDDGAEVASISLTAAGSSTAFPALLSGDAAIGMASRPVKSTEVESFESAGIGRIDRAGTEHVLALDGLIVIVSPDNPLSTINVEDLGAVFSGQIDNWADLGGADAPIALYAPADDSGNLDSFDALVLEPAGAGLAAAARRIASNRELADAVARDPNGIGFTSLAFERGARSLDIETTCGLVVEPSVFNVKTEEYPLSRRLYLYTTGQPLPQTARGLLDYSLSDDAQADIADIGFINQDVATLPLNGQGRRIAEAFIQPRDAAQQRMMREFALELLDAARLSTTLRFQTNSSVLDVKSEADLTRLARLIASGALKGKEVVLIGFADDVSRFEAALALSEQRAQQIQASLEAELARLDAPDATEISTQGFGPLAPVACSGEDGAATNRRVEVWVRDIL